MKGTNVPRNARVRAVVAHEDVVALRVHGGARVDTKVRRTAIGDVDLVELEPSSLLAARTTYEVFVPRPPGEAPQAIVFGAFTTGDRTDDQAPTLGAVKDVRVIQDTNAHGGMCTTRALHVSLAAATSDAGSSPDEVLVGIWTDKDGKLSTDRLPDAFGAGTITLGRSSLCDWAAFSFPKNGGPFTFVVAAFDVAGNKSAPRKVTVTLPAQRSTP